MGKTTDIHMDGAVEATLDIDRGGIPLDASKAAHWLLRVFLVFISEARIRKDSQIDSNRSQRSANSAARKKVMQNKSPANKSPKRPPRRSRTVKGKTVDCIKSSLNLILATFMDNDVVLWKVGYNSQSQDGLNFHTKIVTSCYTIQNVAQELHVVITNVFVF